jgi:hypothetical protein
MTILEVKCILYFWGISESTIFSKIQKIDLGDFKVENLDYDKI